MVYILEGERGFEGNIFTQQLSMSANDSTSSNNATNGSSSQQESDPPSYSWKKFHDHVRKNQIKWKVVEINSGSDSDAKWVATISVNGCSETYISDGAFGNKMAAKESAASFVVKAWGL